MVGTDNRVYSTFWDSATGWYMWFPVEGLTCRPGSTVTVVARDGEHLDLFTTASDGQIMTTFWNSTGGWAGRWWPLPGISASPGSSVTAVSRYSDHLDLFVMSTSNSVYRASWSPTIGWTDWFSLSKKASPGGQVGVVARLADHMDVLAVGAEADGPGQVHNIQWNAADGWDPSWVATAAAPNAPRLTPPGHPVSERGQADSLTIVVSVGTAPFTWAYAGLPPGFTGNSQGKISGTAPGDALGPYTVTVTVTDANHQTASTTFTWSFITVVPDVMGYPRAAAIQVVQAAGLVALAAGKSVGVVTNEAPPAGTEVASGSKVNLIINIPVDG
jgi:hypothetical protein